MDPTDTASAPAPAPDTHAAAPAPAPAPAAPPAPADAVEAMTAALATPEGTTAAAPAAAPAAADNAAADGKPDAGKEKPEGAAAAAPAPAAGEAKPGEKGEEDPYAMPEGLGERAQARFKDLAGRAKEGEAWKQRAEQWQQTIESTGASPEQFGALLTYSSLANSGDPTKLRQALTMLDVERAAIAKAIGEEVPGVDLLADHPDLLQKVKDGDYDRAAALEIARARTLAATTRQQNDVRAQQQATQEEQAAAVRDLNALGAQLATQDPLYAQKYAQLQPMLPIIAKLPPSQWASEFLGAYRNLPNVAAAPAPAPADTTPASLQRLPASPQPLRTTGGGAPAMQKQAASAQEAIEQALGLGT